MTMCMGTLCEEAAALHPIAGLFCAAGCSWVCGYAVADYCGKQATHSE